MEDLFDPYRRWLGIPRHEQPPNHYRLLGINLFEDDPDVIDSAADRQMGHVRTYQTSKHAQASQTILNELAAARLCLLDSDQKAAYDADLRAAMDEDRRQPHTEQASFGQRLVKAAKYAAARADRFWIVRVRLSTAYRQLGQDAHRKDRFREPLKELYARLDAIPENLSTLHPSGEQDPAADEMLPALSGWIKRVSQRLMIALRATRFAHQRRALFRKLGRAVYDQDPQAAGPEELTGPIREGLQRLEQLEPEIAELAKVPPGELVSPRQLAWIIAAVVAVLLLFFCWLRWVF